MPQHMHHINLFQIHGPDVGTPTDELLRTMDDLVKCGKIRYAGACNLTGWQLQKIIERGQRFGYSPFVSLQVTLQHFVFYFQYAIVCNNHCIQFYVHQPKFLLSSTDS